MPDTAKRFSLTVIGLIALAAAIAAPVQAKDATSADYFPAGSVYADVIVKRPAFKQAVQRIRGK